MHWLDLLEIQGTLKSLLQHSSSKPSIFWCSAFFIVQLSHPYMTTGKTIALTRWTTLLLLLLLSHFIHVRLYATPQMAAHQVPPSLGFSRQKRWSGLPFPSPMHESEKVGLKLNIQKTKIMASDPITSCKIGGETMRDFIFWAPKSLQMMTSAMKLKDTWSLEEKL